MSSSGEFIPTPPVWRPPKGDVPTHVPTMSAAERDWHRRNGVSDTAPLLPDHESSAEVHRMVVQSNTLTEYESHVLLYFNYRGRLTVTRLTRIMSEDDDLWKGESPAETVESLHARGFLKRHPGRGGPYSLTELGRECVP